MEDNSNSKKEWIPTEKQLEKTEFIRQKRRKAAHEAKKKKRQRESEQRKMMFADKTKEEIEEIRQTIRHEKELQQQLLEHSSIYGQRICIDVQYNETMSDLERASLITQISLCQRANKESSNHISLHVCGISPDTSKVLKDFGAEHWMVNFHDSSFDTTFSPSECIYMSPDGDSVLETIDSTKVYIIGGIVDRTVNKNLSYERAKSLSIPSYRLPIDKYFPQCSKPILNINTMVELFLKYIETQNWVQSFEVCIPKRKTAKQNDFNTYDYHHIQEQYGDIHNVKVNELYLFQLKHKLHIYCEKHHLDVDIQNIDHFNEGLKDDKRFECIIRHKDTPIGECTTRNSRFAQAIASYYALITLEKEYGIMEIKKKEISKEELQDNLPLDTQNS